MSLTRPPNLSLANANQSLPSAPNYYPEGDDFSKYFSGTSNNILPGPSRPAMPSPRVRGIKSYSDTLDEALAGLPQAMTPTPPPVELPRVGGIQSYSQRLDESLSKLTQTTPTTNTVSTRTPTTETYQDTVARLGQSYRSGDMSKSEYMSAMDAAATNVLGREMPSPESFAGTQSQKTPIIQESLDSISPKPEATTQSTVSSPAKGSPSGAATDEEKNLFKKLHGTSYDPNSSRDKGLLGVLRSSGEAVGGYGDFKKLRTVAYGKQYGEDSYWGKAAKKILG